MRARNAVLLLILVALGIFAALNWTVFTAPAELHLVFARVQAPLGVIMLAVVGGITALYPLLLAWRETTALLEAMRSARELQAQRQLADKAEASRYAELKRYLESELTALRAAPEGLSRDIVARLERVEAELRAEIEHSGNALAAYIGELEDRLARAGHSRPPSH